MGRYSYRKNGFDFGSFEITRREILASISIIAVMLLIGVLISGKISERRLDENEIYNKAVKIESTDLFQHGMDTNIGNAFVYGDLEAVDTVTFPEIGGEYMSVKKETEEYTMHTRTVDERDADGHVTGSHVETYHTWDEIEREELNCETVIFAGIKFDYGQIYKPDRNYITTINDDFDSDIRYVYYGSKTKYTGTIFTDLRDGTISSNTQFFKDRNITETVEYLQSGGGLILFWIFWIILICGCVYGFYYKDNKWLE